MEIKEIDDRVIWENFLNETKEKTFLQSWNWGEFQKMMGEKIWRLGIYQLPISNYQLPIAVALVIKVAAKRGNFLFVPHGLVLKNPKSEILQPKADPPRVENSKQILNSKTQILNTLLEKLREIAKREKVVFIRIAPLWERTKENIKIFKDLGFRKAPIHIHPEATWQLDITPKEDNIFQNMRKTTRNLIRRAEKEGVKIYISRNVKDVKLFYELYRETVKRHHFSPFSCEFLEKEFESFLPDNSLLFFAQWENKILSSAMIIFWQRIAFYHQGASLTSFPKIPASYLLQWEAIKEAKKRGCLLYNFWGIAPTENSRHPWHGLTLFKKGFGGEKREYIKTQDLPLSCLYFKNWIIEVFRKKKRRL